MTRTQKRITSAFLLITMLIMSGCGKNKNNSNESYTYYTVDIDGEKAAVNENDERIAQLYQTVEGYMPNYVVKDYTNPNVMGEFDYYTKELSQTYLDAKRPESSLATMKNYELKIDLVSYEISEIKFYAVKGVPTANVTGSFTSVINHATDAYIDQIKFKQNEKYSRSMSLIFVIEDDAWKITDYNLGSRVKVE